MALKSKNKLNCYFIFYEDLIRNSSVIFEKILGYLNVEVSKNRFKKILRYYSHEAKDLDRLICGWKNKIDDVKFSEVKKMLVAFNLDYLYDIKTGLPQYDFESNTQK
ncbi:MAG: hypothetical protein ACTSRP_17590 [Candidatus Helarchaeota archaeon]